MRSRLRADRGEPVDQRRASHLKTVTSVRMARLINFNGDGCADANSGVGNPVQRGLRG